MNRRVLAALTVFFVWGAAGAMPPEIERAAQMIVSATETVLGSCPGSVWTLVKGQDVLCGHTEQPEEVFASHTAMTHPMFLNTQPWERTSFGIARGLIARTAEGLYSLRVQRLSVPPKDAPDLNFLLEVARLGDSAPAPSAEAAPHDTPVAPADCTRWSLREIRVGMSLADAQKAHPGLKRVLADEGKAVPPFSYTWSDDEHPFGGRVRSDGDTPESKVVSVTVATETLGVTWEEIQAALVQRWGRPSESHTLPTQDGVLVDQVWKDPECDVKGSVVGAPGAQSVLLLGLGSIAAEEEYEKRRKDERESKARKLLE